MTSNIIDPTNKKTARIVGVLFLTAMVASLAGGLGFVQPVLSAPDVLKAASGNGSQLVIGVLLELINAISVLGIAMLMFPILKSYNEHIALGYLGFRIIEAVFCSIIVISPLALITLSQSYLTSGTADAPGYMAAGASLIAIRAAVSDLLIPVFFGLGALLLYFAMFQTKRLPRFISAWGLVAAALVLLLNLVNKFNVEISLTISMIFALPIIANEIFLGIWLLIKGFKPVAQ